MFLIFIILTLIFIALAFYNITLEQYNAATVFVFISIFFAIMTTGV